MDWFSIALISAIFSAIAAILQKKILFDLDALDFSFLLSIINLALVFALAGSIDFNNTNFIGILILYCKTIIGALAFWCVMLSIKNMEISGALPLMVLTPGIVAIFSYLLLGEVISFIQIIGMLFLLIGTYILEIKRHDSLMQPFKTFWESKYHHYIIYALILFTISSIIDKVILRDYKILPTTFLFFQQIFLAINFTIIIILKSKNPIKLLRDIKPRTYLFLVIVSITTLGYRYAQIEAFKIAPIALVLSVKRMSVFFASIIGGKIFSEKYLLKKGIAIIILLYGAYLLT